MGCVDIPAGISAARALPTPAGTVPRELTAPSTSLTAGAAPRAALQGC